jgi:hypothetical protein
MRQMMVQNETCVPGMAAVLAGLHYSLQTAKASCLGRCFLLFLLFDLLANILSAAYCLLAIRITCDVAKRLTTAVDPDFRLRVNFVLFVFAITAVGLDRDTTFTA